MIKIYGSMLCKDCVQCRKDLDEEDVPYTFLDFADDLVNLKEFLVIRNRESQFAPVIEAGRIGIPCIIKEDGTVSLEWHDLLK